MKTVSCRALFLAVLASICYLAFTGAEIPGVENSNDKVAHALAFFVLALLADLSWPAERFKAAKTILLLAYGLAIEFVQHFLPYRDASFLDIVADGIGILLYLPLALFLRTAGLLVGNSRS